MSEEYVEGDPAEGGEEQELTPEELMEQHKAEIDERFEERGFFRRILDMFKGLGQPRSSREYKLARIELQRLIAPLIAIFLPVMGVIVLIVVTAVTGDDKDAIQIEVARAVEDPEELKDEEEPEPEEPPETPPEEMPDVQVDTPVVGPVTDMISNAPPSNEPVSVKPAAQDSVAIIKSPVTMRSMTGSRTPGSIGKMTRGGNSYGDKNTEAAVMKALRWLKKTQRPDGSWANGRGTGTPPSNTGLAILCYLAHGETPASEEFGSTVEKAIQYLVDNQYDKGGLTTYKGVDGNEYATLIATYALCEAYGMTKNPNAKIAAMKGLERIVNNQGPTGGFDYHINKDSSRDDMSFEGWALQALKAGKMAGLHPAGLQECIKKAIKCLQTRNFVKIGFNYVAGGPANGLTATGCLCMQLLGYGDKPEVTTSLETMRGWLPVYKGDGDVSKPGSGVPASATQYYCYYASQCKYQAGMREGAAPADVKSWQDWNVAMKELYPNTMTNDGEIQGPDGKMHPCAYWEQGYGGRTMGTCLCALQLMVYYRYLPTTQTKAGRIESDDDNKKKTSTKKSKDADVTVEVDI